MTKLQELVLERLKALSLSTRAAADRTGIGYPTLLAVVNEGRVPRKPEHREALRTLLELEPNAWASVVASSKPGGVDLPSEGPMNLQQLLTKALIDQGWTELRFAKHSEIAYPTLMGITRKGTIPRGDTLPRLAKALDIPLEDLEAAVERTRSVRNPEDEEHAAHSLVNAEHGDEDESEGDEGEGEDPPRLPALVMAAQERSGLSMGGFARARNLPYLVVSRLISQGIIPKDKETLDAIAAASGLDEEELEAATTVVPPKPEPVNETVVSPAETPTPVSTPPQVALAPRSSANAEAEVAEMMALLTRIGSENRAHVLAMMRAMVR